MSTSLSPRSAPTTVHPTRQQLDELDALLQRMLELPVSAAEEDAAAVRKPETESDRLEPRVLTMPARNEANDATAGDSETDENGEAWVPLRSSWQPSAQTWGPLAKQWQEAQQAGQTLPKVPRKKSPAPQRLPKAEEDEESVRTESVVARRRSVEPQPEFLHGTTASESNEASDSAPLPTSWQVDANAASEPLEPLPSLKALLPPLAAPTAERSPEPAPTTYEPPLPAFLWPFAAIDTLFDGCLLVLGPLGKPMRSRPGKSFLGAIGLLCLTGAAVLAALDWFGWTW